MLPYLGNFDVVRDSKHVALSAARRPINLEAHRKKYYRRRSFKLDRFAWAVMRHKVAVESGGLRRAKKRLINI